MNGISANGNGNGYGDDAVTLFTADNGQLSCTASQEIADKFSTLDDDDREHVIGTFRRALEDLNPGNFRFATFTMGTNDGRCVQMRRREQREGVPEKKIEVRILSLEFIEN
ncbi:MAG: hypothetical protein LBI61_02625 [Puniceicoccales bacterium]|jgi:hypothetical protein|nr:hypothetical protein [Puniceicoccales bacterium]